MATYKQVSYGSQGSDVTELQKLLNKNGYNLTADGIFGSKTQAAVKDYQKKNGLSVDGIVGNNTWGALTKASTPAATTPTQTTGQTTSQTTATTAKPWSYEAFQASESTTAADKKRQDIANQKPGDFTYGAYEKSDVVKQAEALLQQQLSQKPGAYQSQWQTQLDDTLNKILNREKFSYDLNGDALYQQYKDQYVMQGQQAMMDTMGQAQAMTGGYGNSYAQTAGQQAYQGQLQQLNNVIPELYQMALDQYNREGDELYNQYGMYADRENQDYGRYRDQLSDYNTELSRLTEDARYQSESDYGRYMDQYNMAYGQHRDQVADWQTEQARADDDYWNQYNRDYGQYSDDRNLSYQQNRDQVSDDQWKQAFDYQQDRDKKSDEQWQAEFDEAKRQYDQAYELKNGSSSGNGSGSDTGSNTGTGDGEENSTGKGGYDNQGYESSVVKQAQEFVGASADGKWGSNSAAAAKAKGYNSLADVISAMQGGGKPQLSAAGKEFMTKLPYLPAGGNPNDWKNYVDQRLQTAFESGKLSESDVTLILKQLGIE